MPERKVLELRVRLLREMRQNFTLRLLVREARVCLPLLAKYEPLSAVWLADWLERANKLLGKEETPSWE